MPHMSLLHDEHNGAKDCNRVASIMLCEHVMREVTPGPSLFSTSDVNKLMHYGISATPCEGRLGYVPLTVEWFKSGSLDRRVYVVSSPKRKLHVLIPRLIWSSVHSQVLIRDA